MPRGNVDSHLTPNQGEDGKDLKGLAREWMYMLGHQMTRSEDGYFQQSDGGDYAIQVCRLHHKTQKHLMCIQITPIYEHQLPESVAAYYEFVGKVLGIALFHGFLIDVQFVKTFFKVAMHVILIAHASRPQQLLMGQTIGLEDVKEVDAALHTSLSWILDNDPAPLDLCFESQVMVLGVLKSLELLPGGAHIPVTSQNKHDYVAKLVSLRFSSSQQQQMQRIREGFHTIIPAALVQPFTPHQLELMVCGISTIDMADWKENTTYENGYTTDSVQVQWFWAIVEEFTEDKRAKLLQFTTGTSRVPAAGFSALEGAAGPCRFSLFRYDHLPALPRGHACFNRLDLPTYKSKDQVRNKMIKSSWHH